MATVIFYEKPGCINNTKQKAVLQAAGHVVEARNLLTEPWTEAQLRHFMGHRPMVEWFNPTAPRIKSGEVKPEQLTATAALRLMCQDPLLIRRPLLQVGDRTAVGFDWGVIDRWLGLKTNGAEGQTEGARLSQPDLQTCPHTAPVP